MKVTQLHLRDIRCFEELILELNGQSALLVGDNGDGKSTVLRSLAMGLCDDSSASALFRDLYGESVRRKSKQGTVEVELKDQTGRFRTKTTISSLTNFERVDQALYRLRRGTGPQPLEQENFPWHRIFATGYGPGIRVQGTADYDYYLTVDALYPLFVYDRPLQNPELVLRRLVAHRGSVHGSPKILHTLKTLLQRVLQLESGDSVHLTKRGISIRTRQGQYPLSSLGDGYRSTITWLLDLLSWWYLRGEGDLINIHGIVLIDEIEQHLHPRWQRNIMQLLTQTFPNVQFLATTHSPLVASGCAGIPVHRLNQGEHSVENPFGWRAEDVYQMMGLSTSRAGSFIKRVLQEYQRLDNKRLRGDPLSLEDRTHFNRLRQQLEMLPADDPVRLATELNNLAQLAKESSPRKP